MPRHKIYMRRFVAPGACMPAPSTFHRPADGRGNRIVFVNGNQIGNVLWCDTAAGVCVYAPHPVKAKRPERELIYTRRLRGAVTVEPAWQ